MGTKNNPGAFDCYANADPDEPMFVLLGRDPMAPSLVRAWAEMRRNAGEPQAKVDEAHECADAMGQWRVRIGKQPMSRRAGQLLNLVVRLCAWWDEVAKAEPDLNEGERMSIKFEGGCVGHTDLDEALFSINTTTKRVEL